ncbi:MAG: hypothetical protein GY801_08460 [bacterium]|nr:hypothetical protein [bacterium]
MSKQREYKYDVFVSYTDADREWVEGYLLDALEEAGVHYLQRRRSNWASRVCWPLRMRSNPLLQKQ